MFKKGLYRVPLNKNVRMWIYIGIPSGSVFHNDLNILF